jgi:4-hydroxy-tetrahydrodipicolinate synthase
MLAVDAVGVVGTTTHWNARAFHRMLDAFTRGDHEAARDVHASLLDDFAFVNTYESVYSMSVKAMLRAMGQDAGECRLPLPSVPAAVEERARELAGRRA